MTKTTWGAVFNRYKARGADPASAAYSADQWEKRQRPDRWRDCCSTHCERRQECCSPNECCALTAKEKANDRD